MNMQKDIPVLVYLRCDIQRYPGKERVERWNQLDGGRHAAGALYRSSRDVGHEELVSSHLQDGFLVVEGRNPRAGQDLDVSLRFQELNQSGEILGLNSEAKHPRADRAGRRYGSARQPGTQNT